MLTKLAKEIMTSPVITVTADAPVSKAAAIMLEESVGALVVVDSDGNYEGMLSESRYLPEENVIPYMRRTVLRVFGTELGDPENIEEVIQETRNKPIGEVMAKNLKTVSPDAHLAEVAKLMVDTRAHHLTVVDNNKPVGMISRHDLLELFAAAEG
jgi:CBS domain-containing protein